MRELKSSLLPYLYFWENDPLTCIWVAVLHLAFLIFLGYLIIKITLIVSSVRKLTDNFSKDRIATNKYLKDSWALYLQHFVGLSGSNDKTEDFAEQYFKGTLIQEIMNIRLWKSIPGMFVGLGILGTFVGLTMGIGQFENASFPEMNGNEIVPPGNLILGIHDLLGGIKTAFFTSLHGIALSILFGYSEKLMFKGLENRIHQFCRLLNTKFKLTKQDIQKDLFQKGATIFSQIFSKGLNSIFEEMKGCFKDVRDDLTEKLESNFLYRDKNNKIIRPAYVLRDILRESEKQSQALLSFSTDLADVIMERVERLSAESMLPAFEKIINSIDALNSSLKSFSSSTGQDIASELNKAVASLESSIHTIVEDFREAFSAGAVQQLNKVVESMNESSQVLAKMPNILGEAIDEINQTKEFEATKRKEEMSQEFEQIISSFRDSANVIISTLTKAEESQVEREQLLLNKINNALSNSVEKFKDMIAAQEDMLAAQEMSSDHITDLLKEASGTLTEQQAILSEINNAGNLINNISGKFSSISEHLEDETEKFQIITEKQSETTEKINEALLKSQNMFNETSQKFRVIQSGLEDIFSEIEKGLNGYSEQTRKSINNYLSDFTNQVSLASEKLAGSVESLNEFFEVVSDRLEEVQVVSGHLEEVN